MARAKWAKNVSFVFKCCVCVCARSAFVPVRRWSERQCQEEQRSFLKHFSSLFFFAMNFYFCINGVGKLLPRCKWSGCKTINTTQQDVRVRLCWFFMTTNFNYAIVRWLIKGHNEMSLLLITVTLAVNAYNAFNGRFTRIHIDWNWMWRGDRVDVGEIKTRCAPQRKWKTG